MDWGDFPDLEDVVAAFMNPKPSSRRWTGYYVAAESGTYEIALQGAGESNGHRLYLDDKLVIENWKLAKALQPHLTVNLTAGPHKVVVEDYQDTAVGGRLRLAIADQRKLVSESLKSQAAKVDAVVIAAGFDPDSESEGADRTFDLPFGQDATDSRGVEAQRADDRRCHFGRQCRFRQLDRRRSGVYRDVVSGRSRRNGFG